MTKGGSETKEQDLREAEQEGLVYDIEPEEDQQLEELREEFGQSIFVTITQFLRARKGLIFAALAAIIVLSLPLPEPVEFGGKIITLSPEGQRMLALLVAVVIIFVTESLPMGSLVFLVYVWIVFMGIMDPREVAGILSHDAAWFLIGALMIAAVIVKYDLHKRVLMIIFRLVGNKTSALTFGIITFSAVSSAFIADHTVAAMMLPVVLAIVSLMGGFKKVPNLTKLLLFSIAYGCAIGGLATPSGGGRNVLMMGFLHDYFGINISYAGWFVMAFPITLILIPIVTFWLLQIFKPEVRDLSEVVGKIKQNMRTRAMTGSEWGVVLIFAFVLYSWIFWNELGIGMLALFGALLYLIFGFAEWKDYQGINWGIGLLYFGAIGFGSALRSTGAATWLGAKISALAATWLHITGGEPLIWLTGGVTSAFSQVTANGPTIASIGPVFLEMAKISDTDPVVLGITVAISSALAFVFVIGTPPNAIIYGSGYLKTKDFIKAGLLLNLVALVVVMGVVRYWWIGYLGVGVDGFH